MAEQGKEAGKEEDELCLKREVVARPHCPPSTHKGPGLLPMSSKKSLTEAGVTKLNHVLKNHSCYDKRIRTKSEGEDAVRRYL